MSIYIDLASSLITLIGAIISVIACIKSIKAKDEAKAILQKINNNSGEITNYASNNGNQFGNVVGGVTIDNKK